MPIDFLAGNTSTLDPVTNLPAKQSPKSSGLYELSSPTVEQAQQTPGFQMSDYDKYLGSSYVSTGIDLGDARANMQSTGEKFTRSLAKMGVLAGTTFVDNVVGSVVGLGSMAAGAARGETSPTELAYNFIANPLSTLGNRIQEWSEEVMPVYKTKEEEAHPMTGWLPGTEGSANFWFDSVLKNFGFTLGAVASGVLTGGVLSNLSGAKGLFGKLSKGLIGKITTEGKELGSMAEVMGAIRSGTINAGDLTDDLLKTYKTIKNRGLATQIAAGATAAAGESRVEAINASKEFEEKETLNFEKEFNDRLPQLSTNIMNELRMTNPELFQLIRNPETGQMDFRPTEKATQTVTAKVNELHEKGLAKIQNAKRGVANLTFGMNMPLLMASDLFQFGKSFAGGFKYNKEVTSKIAGNIKEGFRADLPTTRLGKIAAGVGVAGKGLKNVVTEAEEEQMQQFISSGSESFYSRQLDPNAAKTVDNLINGFMDGARDAWGSEMGWQQAFVGGITGLAGSPTFSTKKGNRWAGGIAESISEAKSRKEESKTVADQLNKVIGSEAFKTNYRGMIAHTSYQNDMNRALEEDDQFTYENQRHNQFVNDVLVFHKAGKLDQFYENLDGMRNSSVDDVAALFTEEAADGSTINPALNKDPNEVKQAIAKRIDRMREAAKEVASLKDAVDAKLPNVPQIVRDEIVRYGTTIKDVERRINDLSTNLGKFGINASDVESADDVKDVVKQANNYAGIEKEDLVKQAKDLKKLVKRKQAFLALYEATNTEDGAAKLEKKIEKAEEKAAEETKQEVANPYIGKYVEKDGKYYHITKDETTGDIIATPTNDGSMIAGATHVHDTDNKFIVNADFFTDVKEVQPSEFVFEKPQQAGTPVETITSTRTSGETRQQLKERLSEPQPTLSSSLGKTVIYEGKPYVVKKEGDKFVLDSDTRIIELEDAGTTTLNEIGITPEEVKREKYNVLISSEDENSVLVNGVEYQINNDSRGNVESLSPLNKPEQRLHNEQLLIAVEVERNKQEVNRLRNVDVPKQTYEEVKKENHDLVFVEGAYAKNFTDTVATALEKLYDGLKLTEAEKLALDLWVTDAIIEVTRMVVRNPKSEVFQNALDNLELINTLLYTEDYEKYKRPVAEKTSTTNTTKRRTRKTTREARVRTTTKTRKPIPRTDVELIAPVVEEAPTEGVATPVVEEAPVAPVEVAPATPTKTKTKKQPTKTEAAAKPEQPATPPSQKVTPLEGAKRTLYDLYRRLTGRTQKDPRAKRVLGDNYLELNPIPSQRRYSRFVNGLNFVRGTHKAKVVRAPLFYGQYWPAVKARMIEEMKGVSKDDRARFAEEALVAVVVDNNGNYIGEDGFVLTDTSLLGILTKGCYTSIKTPNRRSSATGEEMMVRPVEVDEKTFNEELARIKAAYEPHYNQIKTALDNNEEVFIPIVGKSQGVENVTDSSDETNGHISITELGNLNNVRFDVMLDEYHAAGVQERKTVPSSLVVTDDKGNEFSTYNQKVAPKDATIVAKLVTALAKTARAHKESVERTAVNLGYNPKKKGKMIDGRNKSANNKTFKIQFAELIKNFTNFGESSLKSDHPFYFKVDNGVVLTDTVIVDGKEFKILDAAGNIDQASVDAMALAIQGLFYRANRQSLLETGTGNFLRVTDVDLETGMITYEGENTVEDYKKWLTEHPEGGEYRRFSIRVNPNLEMAVESEDPITGTKEIVTEKYPSKLNQNLYVDFENMEISKKSKVQAKRHRIAGKLTKAEDIEAARKWFETRFPGVDFNVVKGLIDGKAWGAFHKAAVYISDNAEIGTTYHEAFHVVWNLFLDGKQQQDLLDEYRKTHTGEFTDDEIEEKLADEFMQHQLGVKIDFGGQSNKRNFFTRLLDFIKKFLGLSRVTKQEIFERIEAGYYANKPQIGFDESVKKRVATLPGKDITFTRHVMKSFTANFFDYFFDPANKEAYYSLFSTEPNTAFVNAAYEGVRNWMTVYRDQAPNEAARKEIQDVLDNFDTAVALHKETYLAEYNLETVIEDTIVDDENSKTGTGTNYIKESIKVSTKASATNRVRLLIGSLVKSEPNQYGMDEVVDFSSTYALLVNKLANTVGFDNMISVLQTLQTKYPEFELLVNRLTRERPNSYDLQLRTEFEQAMSNHYYQFLMGEIGQYSRGKIFNATTNRKDERIKEAWGHRLKATVSDFNKFYFVEADGNHYKSSAFGEMQVTQENVFQVLRNVFGITFSNDRALASDAARLAMITRGMIKQIADSANPVTPFTKGVDSGLAGYLNTLAQLEARITEDRVENQHINLEGEAVFNLGLNNSITRLIDTINSVNTKAELLELFPHLRNVKYSRVLDLLFDSNGNRVNRLEYNYLEGSRAESGEAAEFSDLSQGDKLALHIRSVLDGHPIFLRPGDNDLERTFTVIDNNSGKPILLVDKRRTDNKAFLDQMLGHVKDDLNEAISLILSDTTYAFSSENPDASPVLAILKEDATLSHNLEHFFNNLETGRTEEQVEEFVNRNISLIHGAIDKFVADQTAELITRMEQLQLVNKPNGETRTVNGFIGLGTNRLPETNFRSWMTAFTKLDMLANIEQLKLMIGNPAAFKSVEDMFKRLTTVHGTARNVSVSESINDLVDRVSERKTKFKDGQPIYTTATFEDIESKSEKYEKINEADAQGYISFEAYRDLLLRSGMWSFGHNSMEELYQWEKQTGETRTYSDPTTGETWTIEKQPTVKFVPLKPVHYGFLAEEGSHPSLFKLSLLPLVPSLVNERGLQQLSAKMGEEGIDIATFTSGNKIGYKTKNGKANKLFNSEGKVTTEPLLTQDTFVKNWGIQLDLGFKSKNKVITGTQMMKQILSNIYQSGNQVNQELGELAEKFKAVNAKRIQLGQRSLLKKLGLKKVKGGYQVDGNFDTLIETLTEEAKKRNLPDNTVQGLQYIGKVIRETVDGKRFVGIDVLPNREKIENVIFSLADSLTTSQKVFGNAAVQISEVMFNADLKFYTKGKNGTTAMEVLLPSYLKGVVSVGEVADERLKEIIGFRIPTQGLNSTDAIIVKGFLPESMGESVVVPKELVAKAGSDFDIDKLNLYFPNYYLDKNGKPVYIETGSFAEHKKNAATPLTEEEFEHRAVENEMYSLQRQILLHSENYNALTLPNSTEALDKVVEYIDGLRGSKTATGVNASKALSRTWINSFAERIQGGNKAIGITALASTFHLACQQHNITIDEVLKYIDIRHVVMSDIHFPHNTDLTSGRIALGGITNKKEENIAHLLSEFINAAVDAAKNPILADLNITTDNLNVALYLTMAGVSLENTMLLFNQPIMVEYFKQKELAESQVVTENTQIELNKKEVIKRTKEIFSKSNLKPSNLVEVPQSTMEAAISKPVTKLNNTELTIQLKLFEDYLRYEESAQAVTEAVQAFKFDTAAAGKNVSDLLVSLEAVDTVISKGLVVNFEKALTDENAFMKPYYDTVKELALQLEPLTKAVGNNEFGRLVKGMVADLAERIQGANKVARISKIVTQFRQDYFTYLLQTSTFTHEGNEEKWGGEVERLFYGAESVHDRVLELQKKYPDNVLLQKLIPTTLPTKFIPGTKVRTPKCITFVSTKTDAVEVNDLTEAWRELPVDFQEDLMKVAVMQTGFQNSPMSFWSLVPVEILNDRLVSLLRTTEGKLDGEINYEDYMLQFAKQNSVNKDIVQRFKEKPNPKKIRTSLTSSPRAIEGTESLSALGTYWSYEGNEVDPNEIGLQLYRMGLALKKYSKTAQTNGLISPVSPEPVVKPVETKSESRGIMGRISDGLSQIKSGMWDQVIKERKLNKEQLMKELANAKTDADIAKILKKLC